MSSLPATLADGKQAELVSLEGELLGLTAPRAFAPGQPVELTARLDTGQLRLAGKTLGSKRREDGRFDVRLRLVNLRKSDRETLQSLLARP